MADLALALTDNKIDVQIAQVPVPSYDSYVQVQPVPGGIRVFSNQALLVDGLLYSLNGNMTRHSGTKRWYFWGQGITTPSLAPKARAKLISAVTEAVNEYLSSHTEFAEVMKVVVWEEERRQLARQVQYAKDKAADAERYLTSLADRHAREVERSREDMEKATVQYAELEAKLLAHMDAKPEFTPTVEVEVEPSSAPYFPE